MIKLFPTNNKCLTPPRLNSMQVDCQGISNSQTFKCILRVIFLCTRHSQHSGRAAQALKVRFENFECANNIPYARVEKRIQIEFICRTMCDPGRKSVLSIRGGVGVGCGNTKKKLEEKNCIIDVFNLPFSPLQRITIISRNVVFWQSSRVRRNAVFISRIPTSAAAPCAYLQRHFKMRFTLDEIFTLKSFLF